MPIIPKYAVVVTATHRSSNYSLWHLFGDSEEGRKFADSLPHYAIRYHIQKLVWHKPPQDTEEAAADHLRKLVNVDPLQSSACDGGCVYCQDNHDPGCPWLAAKAYLESLNEVDHAGTGPNGSSPGEVPGK
jgi:hypothetical protein